MIGIVKSFKTKFGCGFILSEGVDVFVHVSNILPNTGEPSDVLIPGERVRYEPLSGNRGPAASRVERINPPVCVETTGSIKRVIPERGYGFLESKEGDVFFHLADCMYNDPIPGEWVQYILTEVQGKPRGIKVKRFEG